MLKNGKIGNCQNKKKKPWKCFLFFQNVNYLASSKIISYVYIVS